MSGGTDYDNWISGEVVWEASYETWVQWQDWAIYGEGGVLLNEGTHVWTVGANNQDTPMLDLDMSVAEIDI